MSLPTIRTGIINAMSTVQDIGLVHGYERYASKQKDFRTLYLNGQQVLGWFVRRASTRERTFSAGANEITHQWQIRGYMSLDDEQESELTFDDLLESLRAAFRDDPTLGGTVETTIVNNEIGLQIEDTGPVMFAGILCHGCRTTLNTQHYESTEVVEQGEVSNLYVGQSPDIGTGHEPDYQDAVTGEPPV